MVNFVNQIQRHFVMCIVFMLVVYIGTLYCRSNHPWERHVLTVGDSDNMLGVHASTLSATEIGTTKIITMDDDMIEHNHYVLNVTSTANILPNTPNSATKRVDEHAYNIIQSRSNLTKLLLFWTPRLG